jgi:hypothetical protein
LGIVANQAGQGAPPNDNRSLRLTFPELTVIWAHRGFVITKPPGNPALVPSQSGNDRDDVFKLLTGV